MIESTDTALLRAIATSMELNASEQDDLDDAGCVRLAAEEIDELRRRISRVREWLKHHANSDTGIVAELDGTGGPRGIPLLI